MAPDQDVYRKVGRGGAGNYYASTKADEASRDLEAQSLDTKPAPPPDSSSTQTPTRAGRGGAGNYVDPANLPNAREQEEMADKTAAAINASLKRNNNARGGLGGRGGAGNWHDDTQAQSQAQTTSSDEGKGEQIERKVKETIDKGLKLPDKVHHGSDKHNGQ